MKYLKIQNNGLLDVRLLSLMGGTTKANDSFKIGQWGSGLKYSMAWLLRNNLSFRVFIGEREVKITTQNEEIRGEDFEIIYVDGVKTSITTNTGGKAWSAWMIVRELWCNALDEGGHLREITTDVEGEQDKTTFYIQLSPEINEVWNRWTEYFIHDIKPIAHVNGRFRVYENGYSDLKVYKQGVLIKTYEGKKSLFNYDIADAEINELREYKGYINGEVFNVMKYATPDIVSIFYSNLSNKFFEYEMDCDYYGKLSENWVKPLEGKKILNEKVVEVMLMKGIQPTIDNNTVILPNNFYKKITKDYPNLVNSKVFSNCEFFERENKELSKRLEETVEMLRDCNYNIARDIQIKVGFFDAENVMAMADKNNRCIFVSEKIASTTTHFMAATLIEENEHIVTGYSDKTREFQQHFIDLYTKELLERHEVIC